MDNAYWVPEVRVNGRIARTNRTSQTAFRGFGGPQGMLVLEVADPAEVFGNDDVLRGMAVFRQLVAHPFAERFSDEAVDVFLCFAR